MRTRFVLILLTVLFAFVVLFVSILRTASVIPRFSQPGPERIVTQIITPDNNELKDIEIHYRLVFPGTVLPDSPIWSLKAIRDKIWLTLTTSPTRKAELYLLFADKRLGSAKLLFEKGNYEEGYKTLLKAEKYLELASSQEQKNRADNFDTSEFLLRLANASLMHRLVIEQLNLQAPEEIQPNIIVVRNYPIRVYEKSFSALSSLGIKPPKNPFY